MGLSFPGGQNHQYLKENTQLHPVPTLIIEVMCRTPSSTPYALLVWTWIRSPSKWRNVSHLSRCIIMPYRALNWFRRWVYWTNSVILKKQAVCCAETSEKLWSHTAYWARGGAVGWGTALQVGNLRVRFPMVSLGFFIAIILPAALWPGVDSASNGNE